VLDRCRCVLASGKTVPPEIGAVDLAVPRDRNGTFEPQIVRKGQTRLDGFNDRVIGLCALGIMVRDIGAHLREMYQVEVAGPDLPALFRSGLPGLGQADPAMWKIGTAQHPGPDGYRAVRARAEFGDGLRSYGRQRFPMRLVR
jgi:Transposase, Mutator family